MINNCKAFLSGVIVTLATIIFCNTVFAVATGTNISVFYNNIRIFIDGNEIKTKDVNGRSEEPFIFNGTTYVPIRLVSEAFNKIVQWDGDKKQILIADKETYSGNGELKWIDNNTVEFNASLSYNNTEIIKNVQAKYNVLNNALEYK